MCDHISPKLVSLGTTKMCKVMLRKQKMTHASMAIAVFARRIKILFCNVATTVCRPRTFGFADPAVMTPSCATFLTTL